MEFASVLGPDAFFPNGGGSDLDNEVNLITEEVRKAITADSTIPRTTAGGATSATQLGVEYLDGTLRSVEVKQRQLVAWRDVTKIPTGSIMVEYAVHTGFGAYGMDGSAGFSDVGVVSDPTFRRAGKSVKAKYVKAEAELIAQLQRSVGFNGVGRNITQTLEQLKMRELLIHCERSLFFDRSAVSSLQHDGYFCQIEAAATADNNIMWDMRNAPLDKESLTVLADIAEQNNCDLSRVYLPFGAINDLQRSLFPEQRADENLRAGQLGAMFREIVVASLDGDPEYLKVKGVHMLRPGVSMGMPRVAPLVGGPNSPPAPTSVTGSGGAHTATDSRRGLVAGTYYYDVCAVSRGGMSTAATSAAITATAGQRITLTITCNDANVIYFHIFRNKVTDDGSVAGNRRHLCSVARTTTGATTTFYDDRYWEPDTYQGCALSMDDNQTYVAQYCPVMKRVLPPGMMVDPFALILIHTPIMTEPEKNIYVKNIGRLRRTGVAAVSA